jgi:hypothetical protein
VEKRLFSEKKLIKKDEDIKKTVNLLDAWDKMLEDSLFDEATISQPYYNNNYDNGLLKLPNDNFNEAINQSIDVNNNLNENIRRYSMGPRINSGLVEFLEKSFSA